MYLSRTTRGEYAEMTVASFTVDGILVQVYWYDCMGQACINVCDRNGVHYLLGTDPDYAWLPRQKLKNVTGPILEGKSIKLEDLPQYAWFAIYNMMENKGLYKPPNKFM